MILSHLFLRPNSFIRICLGVDSPRLNFTVFHFNVHVQGGFFFSGKFYHISFPFVCCSIALDFIRDSS